MLWIRSLSSPRKYSLRMQKIIMHGLIGRLICFPYFRCCQWWTFYLYEFISSFHSSVTGKKVCWVIINVGYTFDLFRKLWYWKVFSNVVGSSGTWRVGRWTCLLSSTTWRWYLQQFSLESGIDISWFLHVALVTRSGDATLSATYLALILFFDMV